MFSDISSIFHERIPASSSRETSQRKKFPTYNKFMQTKSSQPVLGFCRVPLIRSVDTDLRSSSLFFFFCHDTHVLSFNSALDVIELHEMLRLH